MELNHKCNGCRYASEHREPMFRPFGVCTKETNLIEAEKAYKADVCPYEKNEKVQSELNRETIIKQMQEWSDSICKIACLKGERLNGRVITCESCFSNTVKNALALITSQEQRIKELTEENERLSQSLANSKSILANSKADTVRQMQERLKAQKFTHKNFGELVYVEDIDQIAKEMLEGNNES